MVTDEVLKSIKACVTGNQVVLYMKGSPDAPYCGFSKTVSDILMKLGAKFVAVDVLADHNMREGIKVYSDWPTIPQLYINGEFIGGCDIVSEMYKSGELQTLLQSVIKV